jgi:hypothetical protein
VDGRSSYNIELGEHYKNEQGSVGGHRNEKDLFAPISEAMVLCAVGQLCRYVHAKKFPVIVRVGERV